jgi:hypothetical protein
LRTFIVPSTNREIISRSSTRAAPISGVRIERTRYAGAVARMLS